MKLFKLRWINYQLKLALARFSILHSYHIGALSKQICEVGIGVTELPNSNIVWIIPHLEMTKVERISYLN